MRVLVVEDDTSLAKALATSLAKEGHDVLFAGTAAGVFEVPASDYDLVLLDMGLPDQDGLQVCRRLRAESDVPIIIVTARGGEEARVIGLRSGADDYVVKPFGVAELNARIDAVWRRTSRGPKSDFLDVGTIRVNLGAHEVTVAGKEVNLSPKEFELLRCLIEAGGETVTREEIQRQVWHTDWTGQSRTIDVHVAGLRSKLGDSELIHTVHGVGYRMAVAPTVSPAR